MDDKTKTAAQAKLDFYDVWLADYKQRRQLAPEVQQARDLAAWEVSALNAAPSPAAEVPYQHLAGLYSRELDYSRGSLPPVQLNTGLVYEFTGGSATTSASGTYGVISHAAFIDDHATQVWSVQWSARYEAIQKSQDRSKAARTLLQKLSPESVIEFDDAERNFQAVQAGWQSDETAAATMRNVVDHFKGKLWERVRIPSEQKAKWETILQRLTSYKENSPEYEILLEEGKTWEMLHNGLSEVTHGDRHAGDLVFLHTRMLDHIYAVLSLVEL